MPKSPILAKFPVQSKLAVLSLLNYKLNNKNQDIFLYQKTNMQVLSLAVIATSVLAQWGSSASSVAIANGGGVGKLNLNPCIYLLF